MKILLNSNKIQNYLVVIAIGEKYFKSWKKKHYPLFKKYCKNNNLGMIAITNNLIDKKSAYYKKPQWQKLLVGEFLLKNKINFSNLCIIDGDILVNPFAPNIFDYHKSNKISVVSSRFDMSYDYKSTSRKIAYYRNKFYSKKYLLNSAINMSIKDIFKYHDLKPSRNFFCAGLYVFNKKLSKTLEKIFFKYKSDVKSITNGGDQTHVNYEFQRTNKINWIDYKFQTLWNYEMANYYPFLYYNKNKNIANNCIEASLINNYFLHFAGSWHESKMIDNFRPNLINKKNFNLQLIKYLKKKFKGKPTGFKKP